MAQFVPILGYWGGVCHSTGGVVVGGQVGLSGGEGGRYPYGGTMSDRAGMGAPCPVIHSNGSESPRYAQRSAPIHLPPAHTPSAGGAIAQRGALVPLRGSARAHIWPHTPIRIHPPPATIPPIDRVRCHPLESC